MFAVSRKMVKGGVNAQRTADMQSNELAIHHLLHQDFDDKHGETYKPSTGKTPPIYFLTRITTILFTQSYLLSLAIVSSSMEELKCKVRVSAKLSLGCLITEPEV